ncbi:MAG: caspase family protein [Verrucomicrobiaceae bacterium]|nr:caspase family protein [Verrucomicrobiaceae bacterium]
MRLRLSILVLACAASLSAQDAAENRTALLIGVEKYADHYFKTLGTAAADVKALGAILEKLGFEVKVVTDPNRAGLIAEVDAFGERLAERKGVGLFFFAGHGCMKEDESDRNFLIPSGTAIRSQADLPQEAVNAQRVANRMKEAGNRLNLVFLDACRNNALPATGRSSAAGLAAMRGASGLVFLFATQPSQVAYESDDLGHSLFTAALLKHLGKPQTSFMDLWGDVTAETESMGGTRSDGQPLQSPFIAGTISGRFYFNGRAAAIEPPSASVTKPPPVVAKPAPPPPPPGTFSRKGFAGRWVKVRQLRNSEVEATLEFTTDAASQAALAIGLAQKQSGYSPDPGWQWEQVTSRLVGPDGTVYLPTGANGINWVGDNPLLSKGTEMPPGETRTFTLTFSPPTSAPPSQAGKEPWSLSLDLSVRAADDFAGGERQTLMLELPVSQTQAETMAASDLPTATPVNGRPGFVIAPFGPADTYIDVRDMRPGSKAKCPYTGRVFIVPEPRSTGSQSLPIQSPGAGRRVQ